MASQLSPTHCPTERRKQYKLQGSGAAGAQVLCLMHWAQPLILPIFLPSIAYAQFPTPKAGGSAHQQHALLVLLDDRAQLRQQLPHIFWVAGLGGRVGHLTAGRGAGTTRRRRQGERKTGRERERWRECMIIGDCIRLCSIQTGWQ